MICQINSFEFFDLAINIDDMSSARQDSLISMASS
jgi:hypothetical protein